MTGKLSKNFHGVGIGPLSKILAVKYLHISTWFFQVIQKLQEDLGSIYTAENVVLSATHTHSGPAGFLQYVLFEVSSLGFIEQTFNAMVDGIARVCMDFFWFR